MLVFILQLLEMHFQGLLLADLSETQLSPLRRDRFQLRDHSLHLVEVEVRQGLETTLCLTLQGRDGFDQDLLEGLVIGMGC